jgi:hypothetical protein
MKDATQDNGQSLVTGPTVKRAYRVPALRRLGRVADLTLTTGTPSQNDVPTVPGKHAP